MARNSAILLPTCEVKCPEGTCGLMTVYTSSTIIWHSTWDRSKNKLVQECYSRAICMVSKQPNGRNMVGVDQMSVESAMKLRWLLVGCLIKHFCYHEFYGKVFTVSNFFNSIYCFPIEFCTELADNWKFPCKILYGSKTFTLKWW